MRLRCLAAFAVFFVFTHSARADRIGSFDLFSLTGFGGLIGGNANGTINIDLDTGQVLASTIGPYMEPYPEQPLSQTSDVANNFTEIYFNYQYLYPGSNATSGSGYDVGYDMFLPLADLRNYTGGSVCADDMPCDGHVSTAFSFYFSYGPFGDDPPGGGYIQNDFLTGTLTPDVVATPEPSSLLLLGSGLAGMLGLARRRVRSA